MSGNLDLTEIAANQDQKHVTANTMAQDIVKAVTEILSVSVASGNATISATQYRRNQLILVTGAATSGRSVTLPQVRRALMMVRNASGTHAITLVRGATIVSVPAGATALVTTDGTPDGLIVNIGGGGGGGGTNVYDAAWFDVTAYGAIGDNSTDSTAAIQAAINAAITAGGGTVFFPRGQYVVAGALQDTGRSNAQILLPRIMTDATTVPISVRLLGEERPVSQATVFSTAALGQDGSIIRSTLATGNGAVLGARGPVGSSDNFSFCRVEIQNLTIRLPADPTNSGVDLSHVTGCSLDGLLIDTSNWGTNSIAVQTTTSSVGLRLPKISNGATTELGRVDVIGFYNGVIVGEHTVAQHLAIWGCEYAIAFPAAFHASIIQRLALANCRYGLHFTGGHAIRIEQLNIEHPASGVRLPVYDINDPSNLAVGSLVWNVVKGGVGGDETFLINGGAYLKRISMFYEARVYLLVDAATVTPQCHIAEQFRWTLGGNRTMANPATPYDGQVINLRLSQDGTGGRTITWPSKFRFAGGAPSLSTAANARDFVSCQYDAAQDTWFCAIQKALA